jgi:Na+/proline symporter
MIGVLLYVYYGDMHLPPPAHTDRIYAEFLWNELPPGLAGLAIAAILAAAMANLSAALNSLASTVVVDFFHARSSGESEKRSLRIGRWATVGWAVVLIGIGIAARHSPSVLEAGLSIASIPAGALLGVFLLGVLTRKPGEGSAIAGAVVGLATVLWVRFRTPVAFTWYVPIGTTMTFCTAVAVSLIGGTGKSGAEHK